MLFKRYANPMILLDKMIITKQLSRFVTELFKLQSEEIEEKTTWEFWLHKVDTMSYADFLKTTNKQNGVAPPEEELKRIVADSMEILDGFAL